MVIVKKANAEYRIPDERLDDYIAEGYSQIDKHGNIIREPEKRGEKALKEKISKLETEKADLQKQVAELKKTLKEFARCQYC